MAYTVPCTLKFTINRTTIRDHNKRYMLCPKLPENGYGAIKQYTPIEHSSVYSIENT